MSGKSAQLDGAGEAPAVLEYERLDEEARGKYLREKGLYRRISSGGERRCWGPQRQAEEGRREGQRIRELEAELRRKEKALAETAALLVLKKKAQAIWGDREDGR